jgi:hypothetical protein
MDARTDRELVLGYHPGAVVESRANVRTGQTEYRVAHDRGHGAMDARTPWTWSEDRAGQGACFRLGPRANRA